MSTKIFGGVRFQLSRLGEFVEQARIRGLRLVEKRAVELLKHAPEPKLSKNDRRLDSKALASTIRWRKANKLVELIGLAAKEPERSPFDLTFGWNVFVPPGGRFVLATPWGSLDRESRKCLPKWVESYGYWDNTDPPKDVSSREWRQRERDWEIATAPGNERHCLNLYVFDAVTSRYTSDMSWLDLRLADHKLTNGKPFGTPAPAKTYSRRKRAVK